MSHMEVRAVSAVAEDSETRRRDQVARHVDDERIATLFELTPTPLIAGLAFAVLVAVILWPYRGGMVGGWLLLKFMVGAMRLADVRRFRRVRGRHDEMPRWRRRAIALLGLDGACWGAMGILFMPEEAPGVQAGGLGPPAGHARR